MVDVWKQSKEFENYEISNSGNVRSSRTKKILKPKIDNDGNQIVFLFDGKKKRKRRIARLVADTFMDKELRDSYIGFLDGDRQNPKDTNLILKNKYSGKRVRVKETGEIFESLQACSKALGLPVSTVSRCANYPYYNNRLGYHLEQID